MSELVEIAVLKTRMDELEKSMSQRFDRLEASIDQFIENSEKRFSAKWVENVVKYVVITMLGLVIAAVFKLILT